MASSRSPTCLLLVVVLLGASLEALAQPAAPAEPPAAEPPHTEPPPPAAQLAVDLRNGFVMASSDKAFSLRVQGRMHFDGKFAVGDDANGNDPSNTFRMRRWRITTSGKLFQHYEWVVQVDFANNTASLNDGWIDVVYSDAAKLRLGQYRQPFGLEQDTSDNWVKFLERSMVTNFLTPSYDVGVMVFGELFARRVEYFASVYNGNGLASIDNNDPFDYAGRVVLRPFAGSPGSPLASFQIGGAVTYGKQRGTVLAGGPQTQLGTRLFAYDAGVTLSGDRVRFGGELGWWVGPFELTAELITVRQRVVDAMGVSGEPSFLGWLVESSYYLTGEANGRGRPKVKRPFTLEGPGGPGAINLAARVVQLRSDDPVAMFSTGLRDATEVVIGPNWYPNTAVRVNLDYEYASFDGGDSEHAGMLRVQVLY